MMGKTRFFFSGGKLFSVELPTDITNAEDIQTSPTEPGFYYCNSP